MADIRAQKRALPQKVAAMRARKRRKLGLETPRQDEDKARPDYRQPKKPPKSVNVSLDNLNWSAVPIPEHMDDYSGFFGLDEIEGIDVVKELNADGHNNTKISFRMASDTTVNRTDPHRSNESEGDALESEEEWAGLDDDERSAATTEPNYTVSAPSRPYQRPLTGHSSTNDGDDTGSHRETLGLDDTPFSLLPVEESDIGDISAWNGLSIDSRDLLRSLSRLNFSKPTAIQSAAIPLIQAGHDVIGKAPTGSGKTLAYGIPLVDSFISSIMVSNAQHRIIALVIVPTRELAHQIRDHLEALCSHLDDRDGRYERPTIGTLTGGLSVQKQLRMLQKAAIVVATPGRLWELISEEHGVLRSFREAKFLVVDEADRLLSEGSFKELEEVIQALDRETVEEDFEPTGEPQQISRRKADRQTLVFSATFSRELRQQLARRRALKAGKRKQEQPSDQMQYLLQRLNFREEAPHFVDINPESESASQLAPNLQLGILNVETMKKDLHVYSLLLILQTHDSGLHKADISQPTRVLIFTNSIVGVRRLSSVLRLLGFSATFALHSHQPQKSRLRAVERFSHDIQSSSTDKEIRILVATDVAARGLDLPHVQIVIHYNVPRTADTYIHRSGRTARAERLGYSILMCSANEYNNVTKLVAQVHRGKQRAKKDEPKPLSVPSNILEALSKRVELAQTIETAEAGPTEDAQGKQKIRGKEDRLFAEAAEDLGVDSDDEAHPSNVLNLKNGKFKKTKSEIAGLRAELAALLSSKKRINLGVSERYLTGADVGTLLRERKQGHGRSIFLGHVPKITDLGF